MLNAHRNHKASSICPSLSLYVLGNRFTSPIRKQYNHHKWLASRKAESVEELETLYPQAQSQGHHTINRLEERHRMRKCSTRFSFTGRERAIVSQTSTGAVTWATFGEASGRCVRAHNFMCFSERRDITLISLKWAEMSEPKQHLALVLETDYSFSGSQNLYSGSDSGQVFHHSTANRFTVMVDYS